MNFIVLLENITLSYYHIIVNKTTRTNIMAYIQQLKEAIEQPNSSSPVEGIHIP